MLDKIFGTRAAQVRISFGLVGMIVSLLLIAALLGLIPDKNLIVNQHRAAMAEALAVNGSVFITLSDIERLSTDLQLVVDRNDEIMSAAVISTNKQQVTEIGDHIQRWRDDSDPSSGAQVSVPLYEGGKTWGHLQMRFIPLKRSGWIGYFDDTMVQIISFVSASGFLMFFFYLGSMLKQLDPSQAIPGRVRSALDTMAEGLLVLDSKQNIVLANQAFATIVGSTSEALLGKPINNLPWVGDNDSVFEHKQAPWKVALDQAEAQISIRVKLRSEQESATAEQTITTFMTNCSPVLAREGKAQGVLISFDDITELERKEVELQISKEEAEAANRSKSEFLSTMSHEIRTPMNSILGFTTVLQRGYGKDSDTKKYLKNISNSSTHLLTLINDILDLSKVEAGKIEIELADGSAKTLIHEILTVMQVKADEKYLSLNYEPSGPIPRQIRTDMPKLRQILINLIGNALKFTEQGGVTIVSRYISTHAQRLLTIDVIDTGVGMTEEQVSKVFEAFVQADNTITRRFGGTGLGLSISKKFALALGGDITISSEPGQGSTFSITLPVEVDDEADTISTEELGVIDYADDSTPEGFWVFPTAKILVVDDGSENRSLLELVLGEAGLSIDVASNGSKGLEMALTNKYDAILMDVQMAIMDGLTSVGHMRSRGITVPVVALTADAMKGVEEICKQAGYSHYMPKPINLDKLFALLADLLGGHHEQSTTIDTTTISSDTEAKTKPRELTSALGTAPIVSSLSASSPKLTDLVRQFVPRLHEELGKMRLAAEEFNHEQLASLAHWLRGSAGSVGFHQFTEPANELEQHAKAGDISAITDLLNLLMNMAGRIVVADLNSLDGDAQTTDNFLNAPLLEERVVLPLDQKPIRSSLPMSNKKLRDLVSQFIDRLNGQFIEMRSAFNSLDYDSLKSLAHWLKGSAGTLGFHQFTEISDELEIAINSQSNKDIERLLVEIELMIQRMEQPD